jgi:hypothetical protein
VFSPNTAAAHECGTVLRCVLACTLSLFFANVRNCWPRSHTAALVAPPTTGCHFIVAPFRSVQGGILGLAMSGARLRATTAMYRDGQCETFAGAKQRLANVDVRFCGLFSCVGRQDVDEIEGKTIAHLYPSSSVIGFHGQGEIGPHGFTDEDPASDQEEGHELSEEGAPPGNLPFQADIHGYSLSTIAIGLLKPHPSFPFDCRVEVHGLTSAAGQQMNGQTGVVSASATSFGRLAVLLEGAERPKAIKEANLLRKA